MTHVPLQQEETRDEGPIEPAIAVRLVTPGGGLLPEGQCRALWAGAAGDITFVDSSGETITDFTVVAGLNPIRVRAVTASVPTLWALY